MEKKLILFFVTFTLLYSSSSEAMGKNKIGSATFNWERDESASLIINANPIFSYAYLRHIPIKDTTSEKYKLLEKLLKENPSLKKFISNQKPYTQHTKPYTQHTEKTIELGQKLSIELGQKLSNKKNLNPTIGKLIGSYFCTGIKPGKMEVVFFDDNSNTYSGPENNLKKLFINESKKIIYKVNKEKKD